MSKPLESILHDLITLMYTHLKISMDFKMILSKEPLGRLIYSTAGKEKAQKFLKQAIIDEGFPL